MTYQTHMLRPAMTAIAAVIALTATPSIAQSVEASPPIIDTTPVTSAPDPLAAEPVVTTASPDPMVSETIAPVAVTPTKRAAKPATRSSAAPTRSRMIASTNVARPSVAAPVAAIAAAPAAALLVPAPPVAAVPVAPEPVAAPAPVVAADSILANDALPIAGAAGLGLLALFGAGMAMRRRRRDDEEFAEQDVEYIDAEPEAMIEPTPSFVRTPQADPAPVAAPVAAAAAATTLPIGFDISRFGPNVQAAYRGPTEDNPSMSLKRRLTVGSFLDKKAAESTNAAPVATTAKPASNPAWAARTDSDFMFRREGHTANLKRAFQS